VSAAQGSGDAERAAQAGATPTPEEIVRARHAEIFGGFADGLSLESIGETIGVPAFTIRHIVLRDKHLRERWNTAREHRAETFIEAAADQAYKAGRAGEAKAAGDLYIKLAEKTAPKVYGSKSAVELTGADGAQLSTMSDAQLEAIVAAASRGRGD
jgi:hypothetical protein